MKIGVRIVSADVLTGDERLKSIFSAVGGPVWIDKEEINTPDADEQKMTASIKDVDFLQVIRRIDSLELSPTHSTSEVSNEHQHMLYKDVLVSTTMHG